VGPVRGFNYIFVPTTITSSHTDTFSIIIIIKQVFSCFNIVDCVSLDPKCRDVVAENMQLVTTCTYAVDVVLSPRPLTSIYAITHRFSETPMIQYREILEICTRYPHALSPWGVVKTANANQGEISYGSGLGDPNWISGSVILTGFLVRWGDVLFFSLELSTRNVSGCCSISTRSVLLCSTTYEIWRH
jgi:hypothetical protein